MVWEFVGRAVGLVPRSRRSLTVSWCPAAELSSARRKRREHATIRRAVTAPDAHPGVGDCGICPASQHRGGAGCRASLGLWVSIMHRSSGVTVPARIAPALQMAFRIPGQQHGPPRCPRGRVGGSLLTLAKRLRNETDVVGQASGWFKPGRDLHVWVVAAGALGWAVSQGASLPAVRATGAARAVSSPGQPMPAGGRKPAEARQGLPTAAELPRTSQACQGTQSCPALLPRLGIPDIGDQNLKPELKPGRGGIFACMRGGAASNLHAIRSANPASSDHRPPIGGR